MQAKPKKNDQVNFLYQDIIDQLNPTHPLLKLAEKILWQIFEDEFNQLYCGEGRPAKRVRLMVGLLILKQLENLSDERVVEPWVQNLYFQAFYGEISFQWQLHCDSSELVYFRKRIGENGVRLIFESSVDIHGADAKETEVLVDTTVQEKNIIFPTDVKLLTKIIQKCRKIAEAEGYSCDAVSDGNCRSCCANAPNAARKTSKSEQSLACSFGNSNANFPVKP